MSKSESESGSGYVGTWEGGRVYKGVDGGYRFIIRRRAGTGGQRSITLDVDVPKGWRPGDKTPRAALIEVAGFEEDPLGFQPKLKRQEAREAAKVVLTVELIAGFVAYLRSNYRTHGYLVTAERHMSEILAELPDQDLAKLDAQTLQGVMARWDTAVKIRPAVFKSFCTWLVTTGQLDANADPGRHLTVESNKGSGDEMKGYALETVQKIYRACPDQAVRDVVCIMAKTGLHFAEVERLAKGKELAPTSRSSLKEEPKQKRAKGAKSHLVEPTAELQEWTDCGEVKAVIKFLHKTRRVVRHSIDGQALAAVRRLQAAGKAPWIPYVHKILGRVHKENKTLPAINPGSLRHSFATWLSERGEQFNPHSDSGQGLPEAVVAQALHHANVRTTRQNYLKVQVPVLFKTPLKLFHPEDPAPVKLVKTHAPKAL